MKKLSLLILVIIVQKTFAQNTFPTTGNVGVGTTSPLYLLDVNSAAQRLYNPTGSTFLRIEGNGSANFTGSYIYLNTASARVGDTFTKVRIDANRGSDSTANFQLSRMNGDTYTGFFYRYDDPLGHRFLTASRTATSTSEVFRISPEGHVGIGSTTLYNRGLALATPITGGTVAYGMLNNGVVKSDVTAGAYLNYSQLNTQATSFTLPTAVHFVASEGIIGAGSTITSQIGYAVSSNMVSAINNYGYRSGIPLGASNWNLYFEGSANNFMAGALGIGSTSLTGNNLRVTKTITGATTSIGIRSDGQVQSDVTEAAFYYRSDANTVASATIGQITHYYANQSGLGAGSTVGSQIGFYAGASMIGGTNNFGFYGNIPAGSARWNLYMAGTANNYLGGRLGIGTTSLSSSNLGMSLPLTGNSSFYSMYNYGIVQSDVTGVATYYRTGASTQDATFTLGNMVHYGAYQGSFGSSSAVTNQFGVYVDGGLVGATNNYGVFSAISTGTGRWNLYMSGTANNYFAGNVGIGTNIPTARLDVRTATSSAPQTNPNISARGAGNSFEFGHPNPAGYVSTIGANYSDGRPFLCFNCEAGTTNNTYKTRGIIGTIITPDLLGGLLFGRIVNSNGDNQALTADMVLKGGQLGIGTSSIPTDYKLAVGGNIIAEKIKVKKRIGGVWPDYVFSPTYKLPSLEEIEVFTKKNSHLPEIPSAKEIENEGQDLGEMNRLLLKKVEELTLYMIEQNKEIKALKLKVEQLEKK